MRSDVILAVGSTVGLNFELAAGSVSEVLEVVATATDIQTEKADFSTVIEDKKIRDLPLVARNVLTLAALQPGINGIPGTTDLLSPEQGLAVTASGQRESGNNSMVDGMSHQREPVGRRGRAREERPRRALHRREPAAARLGVRQPAQLAAHLMRTYQPPSYPTENLRDLGSPAPDAGVIGPPDGIPDVGTHEPGVQRDRPGRELDGHELPWLTAQLSRRYDRGFSFQLAYTLGKAEDTLGNPVQVTDPEADRGPADFDVRHKLTTSFIVALPFRSDIKALDYVIGGWS